MSACADTKYKSVFVMSEEKDECIIATEVSFVCLFLTLFFLTVQQDHRWQDLANKH